MKLNELNTLPDEDFVRVLSGIFEHSAWVPSGVLHKRPFASIEDLHQSMVQVVDAAGLDQQLTLIRAHPDLAGKAARAGGLTDESTSEQQGAGLDRLTDVEFEQFHQLNAAYQERFSFPFILAVRGFDGISHDKYSIIAAFQQRLNHNAEQETAEALRQIARIAQLRLQDLLSE